MVVAPNGESRKIQEMRKSIALSLVGLTLVAVSAFAAMTLPQKAAEFAIKSPDGKQILLSSYRGKTVILAFMFTTCSHCQHVATVLSGIQKEYADKGVQVLGATFDADAATQVKTFDMVFAKGFPCGYASNEAVLRFLQQPATEPPFVPILTFIDKSGTIRSIHMVTGNSTADSPEQKFFQTPEVTIRQQLDKILKAAKN